MQHLASIRLKTLILIGLILLTAGTDQPAWSAFPDWRKYLEILSPTSAALQGTVRGYSADPLPLIVVFYYDADEPQRGVLGSGLTRNGGDFGFSVKAPGRYRIMAFEDLNGDLAFQSNEPAGICESPSPIVARPGETLSNLFVRIQVPGAVHFPLKGDVSLSASSDIATELDHYQMGQVVSLDDPRFSAANARWGLWVPLEFLPGTGAGLYFLQEYAKEKMPILFVHGSGGNPTDFRFLIEGLDRSRYQPWVYFYPRKAWRSLPPSCPPGGTWPPAARF